MTSKSDFVLEKIMFDNLQPNQSELFQLAELAGLKISPQIIGILIQMLNMKVAPETIYKLLKSIRRSTKTGKHRKSSSIK